MAANWMMPECGDDDGGGGSCVFSGTPQKYQQYSLHMGPEDNFAQRK